MNSILTEKTYNFFSNFIVVKILLCTIISELDLPRYVLKHNKPLVDKRANVFLVPMNGGIWTLCIDLTPEEIRSLSGDGFPQVDQCVNYLAGSTEGGSGGQINEENSRAEWQHSEFQPSLHPHLSRYNCV